MNRITFAFLIVGLSGIVLAPLLSLAGAVAALPLSLGAIVVGAAGLLASALFQKLTHGRIA